MPAAGDPSQAFAGKVMAPIAAHLSDPLGQPARITVVTTAVGAAATAAVSYRASLSGVYAGPFLVELDASDATILAGLLPDEAGQQGSVARFGRQVADAFGRTAGGILGAEIGVADAPDEPRGSGDPGERTSVVCTLFTDAAPPAAFRMVLPRGMYMALVAAVAEPGGVGVRPARFPALEPPGPPSPIQTGVERLLDVPFTLSARLGQAVRRLDELTKLGPGTLIELDRLAGEPVDLYVNDVWIGRGEVVVVDENFGVRITALGAAQERLGLGPAGQGGGTWGRR